MTDPIETTARKAGFDALRVAVDERSVGKLPKITCKACSDKRCQEHAPSRCQVCKQFMTPRHIHVDFFGHAGVTDRLLAVDPEWRWEWGEDDVAPDGGLVPSKALSVERDDDGYPRMMSIRLTVLGVTRREFGYVARGKAEPFKELISDALARAAMRFGVALELWSKTDLESQADDPGADDASPAPQGPARPCPLCGFDLTNEPLKKQDGAYVHKQCPVPAPREAGGAEGGAPPSGPDAAPPGRGAQDAGGEGSGEVAAEPPAQPELPSDDARSLHEAPDKPKGRAAAIKAEHGMGD